jgi:hypothetical protein
MRRTAVSILEAQLAQSMPPTLYRAVFTAVIILVPCRSSQITSRVYNL